MPTFDRQSFSLPETAASTEVASDPAVLGGEPTFRGTRIPVNLVASLLQEGATDEQIIEAYPRLTCQMIRLAPVYAGADSPPRRPPNLSHSAIRPKRIVRKALPPTKR